MDLREFESLLKTEGFHFIRAGRETTSYSVHKMGSVPYVGKFSAKSPSFEVKDMRVTYPSSAPEDIEDSLDLRDLLERNEVKYSENPERAHVALVLRETADRINNLVKRVEGK